MENHRMNCSFGGFLFAKMDLNLFKNHQTSFIKKMKSDHYLQSKMI